jgi:two-component system sensor histidine kinase BaeS
VTTRRLGSTLTLRLAVAFVTVAIAALAVFAVLTVSVARGQLQDLVSSVHRSDTDAAAASAARAYEAAGGWENADLSGPVAIAARDQATITVIDASGETLREPTQEAADMLERMHGIAIVDVPRGDPLDAAVVVGGQAVGTLQLRFPLTHLPTPEEEVRTALTKTALIGGIVAIVAAIAMALFVAGRVSEPLTALTEAATQMAAGKRDVRVDMSDAPGELGTLARTFDTMAAAVQREDQLRRQLVRDLAHEVRTPLSILRGTTEALVDGVVTPDEETLTTLHDEVLQLTRLVGDLETLADAEAAGLHMEAAPVDLADVARDVTQLAAAAAADAELRLEVDLLPAPVMGDTARLHQVAVNLLSNAIRYTPAGGEVTARTGTTDRGAFLEVLDSGPGLDPDEIPRLFERFYRGHAADADGSGIGLAVARELVQAHGGAIEAANRPEGGAVFRVELPRSAAAIPEV